MKISTQTIMQQPVNAMLEQQEALYKTEKQLASGKRILQPSDDPTGSVRANQLRDSMSRTEQYIRSGESAESKLNMEEGVIESLTNAVQRIRDLSIQSLNGTLTDDNRKVIGTEVEQLFYEVVNLANSRNETGEYIFSGSQGDVKPFTYVESAVSNINSLDNIGVLRPTAGVGANGVLAETLTFSEVRDGAPIPVTINANDSAETIAASITTALSNEKIFATATTVASLEHFTVGSDGDAIGFSIGTNGNTSAVATTAIATAPSATRAEVNTILTQVQTAIGTLNTANGDTDLSASIDDAGVISIISAAGRDISIIDVAGGGSAAIDVANTTVSEGANDSLNVGGSVTVSNPDGTYYNVTSTVPNNVMAQTTTISETLSLSYHGDNEQRRAQIGDSVSIDLNDSGDQIFMNLASAVDSNTERSLFQTIHALATELKMVMYHRVMF